MTGAETLSNPHDVRGHADSGGGLIVQRARRCGRTEEAIRALEAATRAARAGTVIKVIAVGPDGILRWSPLVIDHDAGLDAHRSAVRAEIQKIRRGLP